MTRLEFENLTLEERIKYATSGTYVDTVKYYGYMLLLYSMDDGAFCEVWYHQEENRIIRVGLCDDYDLKKYLPHTSS